MNHAMESSNDTFDEYFMFEVIRPWSPASRAVPLSSGLELSAPRWLEESLSWSTSVVILIAMLCSGMFVRRLRVASLADSVSNPRRVPLRDAIMVNVMP